MLLGRRGCTVSDVTRGPCHTSWSTEGNRRTIDTPPSEGTEPSGKGKAGAQLRKDRGAPAFPRLSVSPRHPLTRPRELSASGLPLATGFAATSSAWAPLAMQLTYAARALIYALAERRPAKEPAQALDRLMTGPPGDGFTIGGTPRS